MVPFLTAFLLIPVVERGFNFRGFKGANSQMVPFLLRNFWPFLKWYEKRQKGGLIFNFSGLRGGCPPYIDAITLAPAPYDCTSNSLPTIVV